MKTTTFNSVENIVCNLNKGTFGVTLITVTVPKMSQTKRATKEVNPFFGRVHKCSMTTNVALGYGYENNVNLRLKRKGNEANFEAEKPNGKHWVEYPLILASDKNPEQHYLRTTARNSSKVTVVYLIDGKPCHDTEILNQLKEWLPKPSVSKKQEEHGLEEEEQVKVFDYKVEGVMCISQGGKTYNKLDKVFTIEAMKTFFK